MAIQYNRPILIVALMFAGCGGSGIGGQQFTEFGLRLTAVAPVAGVEWNMSPSLGVRDRTFLAEQAQRELGTSAQVLVRASAKLNDAPESLGWAVFARGVAGRTQFELMRRNEASAADLPAVVDVLCADVQGNPVSCVLRWERL